jgi:hypothetical protein
MAQEIKPAYATFEQAKLLKEKGLNDHFYHRQGEDSTRWVSCKYCYDPLDESKTLQLWSDNIESSTKERLERLISAPEQWQVVEWLRVNHGIWIELRMGKDSNSVWFDYDIFSTIKPRKDDELGEEGVEYEEDPNERFLNWDTTHDSLIDEKFEVFTKTSHDSPQEAYSAAFDYILNNLI